MPRAQVVLIDMPTMLREIVREEVVDAGMHVAGELRGDHDLESLLERSAAEVVIAAADTLDPLRVSRLLAGRPRLTVLTIEADGRQGVVYERFGEVGPKRLVELVARLREPAGESAA